MIVYKTNEDNIVSGFGSMLELSKLSNDEIIEMCKKCAVEYGLEFDSYDTECEIQLNTVEFRNKDKEDSDLIIYTGTTLVNFSIFDKNHDEWLIKLFGYENAVWFYRMDDYKYLIEGENLEEFINKYK